MPSHGPSPVWQSRGQAAPDLRVAMFGQEARGAQRQFKETVGLHQSLAKTAAARQPGGVRRFGGQLSESTETPVSAAADEAAGGKAGDPGAAFAQRGRQSVIQKEKRRPARSGLQQHCNAPLIAR